MTADKNNSRLQMEIESNLKRAYDNVLKEDVPDRFTQLLAQLQQTDRGVKEKSE